MLQKYQLQKPIVMGLGKTGLSFIKFLKYLDITEVAVWDSNPSAEALATLATFYPQVKIFRQKICEDLLQDYSCICLSPGIPRSLFLPFMSCPPIISEFDIFAMLNKSPVIGVTGTNGKSTVCHLLYLMAKAHGLHTVLGGNFGLPILDEYLKVLQNQDQIDIYILELSSFQLESIQFLPLAVACVLNVTPDHLDRYPDFTNYVATKNAIYDRSAFAVYNLDQKELWPEKQSLAHATFASLDANNGADYYYNHKNKTIYFRQKPLADISDWHKQGRHYAENVMAALAIGHSQGWDFNIMLEVAKSYRGLRHRCQWITTRNDVKWYNDSKATNIASAIKAIEGVSPAGKKVIWIAGGRGKNSIYHELAPYVKTYVKQALLIGEEAQPIEEAIIHLTKVLRCQSLPEAVRMAADLAECGDVVLLSPACASFDMFDNYEHRGDVFEQSVMALDEME